MFSRRPLYLVAPALAKDLLISTTSPNPCSLGAVAFGLHRQEPGARYPPGEIHMRKLLACLTAFLLAALPLLAGAASAADQARDDDRLRNCGTVLKEILDVPDNIPQDLLDKADCVVVFPSVLKAAFIVGGSYGRGAMSCRKGQDFRGPWGAPTMMALEGGSLGFQIGGEATDFVLLVMNESGARGILASKVKLGGDASVAAGPVGRDASADTDATLRSEILS